MSTLLILPLSQTSASSNNGQRETEILVEASRISHRGSLPPSRCEALQSPRLC